MAPDALTVIERAAARALELLLILDREHTTEELHGNARAVRHELLSVQDSLGLFALDVPAPREGKVRADAPETGQAAARAIATRSGSQRHKILQEISLAATGRTDAELQFILHLGGNSERPRRVELKEAGYIRVATWEDIAPGQTMHPPDQVATRMNPSTARACEVWTVTELGRAALRKLESGQAVLFEPEVLTPPAVGG
jgi:hypothetical protein